MRGQQGNTGNRHEEPNDLATHHTCSKQREVQRKNHHGNTSLNNGGIDGGGVLQRGVEKGVEAGVTDDAQPEEIGQVLFDHRPVTDQLRHGNGKDESDRKYPAQICQHHGTDVAKSQFSGDSIAAPAQCGDDQGEVGS